MKNIGQLWTEETRGFVIDNLRNGNRVSKNSLICLVADKKSMSITKASKVIDDMKQ